MKKVNAEFFIQATKVDEVLREVHGFATTTRTDKAREVVSYKRTKPLIEKWSNGFVEATKALGEDTLSYGNVRGMHGKGPSTGIVAGKLTQLTFDDAAEKVFVVAKITDDNEWEKCRTGTYTGFSIGGRYVGAKTLLPSGDYEVAIEPYELALADNPCNPDCHFQAVKADGTVVERPFAWFAEKSMYSVGNLAQMLQCLADMQLSAEFENELEGDDSSIPDDLRAWIKQGVTILLGMTKEESAEMLAGLKSAHKQVSGGSRNQGEEMTKEEQEQLNKAASDSAAAAKAVTELESKIDAKLTLVADQVVEKLAAKMAEKEAAAKTEADKVAADAKIAADAAAAAKTAEADKGTPAGGAAAALLGQSKDGETGAAAGKTTDADPKPTNDPMEAARRIHAGRTAAASK